MLFDLEKVLSVRATHAAIFALLRMCFQLNPYAGFSRRSLLYAIWRRELVMKPCHKSGLSLSFHSDHVFASTLDYQDLYNAPHAVFQASR